MKNHYLAPQSHIELVQIPQLMDEFIKVANRSGRRATTSDTTGD